MTLEDKYKAIYELKLLLGIKDGSQDALLLFLIDDCIARALGYCRIDKLPEQLYSLIPVMAARAYRVGGYGRADPDPQAVKLQQGERSVWFDTGEVVRDDWMNDFKSRLEPFRRRRGRVPSEL